MNHLVFKDVINQIHSDKIKKFVTECLKDAPDELEIIPAAISKKYHPPQAREEGGLVWHIQRACWFGFQFIQSQKWDEKDIRGDILLAGLILHDIGKKSKYKKYWDYVDHPKTASKMIARHKGLLPPKVFLLIQSCVLHHMGPFGGKFWKKPMNKYNSLELMAYLADYMASRAEIGVIHEKG